jgi:hypothetical protein
MTRCGGFNVSKGSRGPQRRKGLMHRFRSPMPGCGPGCLKLAFQDSGGGAIADGRRRAWRTASPAVPFDVRLAPSSSTDPAR